MKLKKYALIYNFPQHYREAIFKKLDQELDIDFYFGDHLDWAPDIKKMNVDDLKGFKGIFKNKRFFKYFIWQVGALKTILRNRYTHIILYGDSFYISNWFILILSKIMGVKTAIWTHGLYKPMNLFSRFYNILFYRISDEILLYGNYSKNKMINLGFDSNKLQVIYNSLNYEKQVKIRDKMTFTNIYTNYFHNKKPVFLYIGRIQKIKKIDLILNVLRDLKDTEYEFNFVVIGKDNENVKLELIVEKYNLQNNVWFYGGCYDEEKIGELIYNAVSVVSPGNIGLTAIHSLVYGTPCITHNDFNNQMPEFEAIKDNFSGSFFVRDDVDDLKKTVIYWQQKYFKDIEQIKVNCYSIIDEFYNPNYQLSIFKNL